MQGYGINSSGALPPLGSVPNPYWDNARVQHHSQNVDSMPALQVLPNLATSSVNTGVSSWLNIPVQGGLASLQNNLDIHQTQNIPPQSAFGIQQRLQPQNPSVANLLPQPIDNLSNMLTPEKLLASGISQDPQLVSLLQQQYLLQLQSQAPVASQQLLLFDKLLLLKQQQQKQEEHQQLMRQQQQLLSQVFSEHHLNQRLSEPTFAQLQTGGFEAGNANIDHARFQQHDLFQMGAQLQAPSMPDENVKAAGLVLPSSDSQDISRNIGSENSMHLPHQIFANSVKQGNWNASPPEEINKEKGSYGTTDDMDMTQMSEKANKKVLEQTSKYDGSVLQQLPVHENEQLLRGNANALADTPARASEELLEAGEQHIDVSSQVKEVKIPEAREMKKSSEKKSKKQKSSKVSTDSAKGVSKSQQPMQADIEVANSGDALEAFVPKKEKRKTDKAAADADFLQGQNSSAPPNYADKDVTAETKVEPEEVAYDSQVKIQTHAGQRAWKPAPGFKPKSFLEIQQEEQRRAQEEMAVSDISTSLSSMSVSTPWAGVVVNADHKAVSETRQDAELNLAKSDSYLNPKNKTQEEELFWDANISKLGDREMEISKSAPGVPLTSIISSQSDSVIADDFIDAKDTKKSRKKSAKAKNAGGKVAPVSSVDVSLGSSPIDKGKHIRQMQQKEVLPAVPSGPSFGDYVFWKEESASPSPAPAWSTDSGKTHKAASLRDILKEQEKKVPASVKPVQMPTPQKPATNQPARGSGPSWSVSSSPAKAASPLPINSQASSHSNHKVEDDLFWGPLEQPKPEAKQYGSLSPFHFNYYIIYIIMMLAMII